MGRPRKPLWHSCHHGFESHTFRHDSRVPRAAPGLLCFSARMLPPARIVVVEYRGERNIISLHRSRHALRVRSRRGVVRWAHRRTVGDLATSQLSLPRVQAPERAAADRSDRHRSGRASVRRDQRQRSTQGPRRHPCSDDSNGSAPTPAFARSMAWMALATAEGPPMEERPAR